MTDYPQDEKPVDERIRPWDEFIMDAGRTYVIDPHGKVTLEYDGQFIRVREIKRANDR